jgi:hypothetical protein
MLSLTYDRDAMQWSAWALRLPLGIERLGDRERVGIRLNHRPESRPGGVDLRDTPQIQLHEPV